MPKTSLTKELLVSNRCGVHLRVGSMLVQKAKEFTSSIRIKKGSYVADCRSVLDLLSLGAFQGDAVVIEAEGNDAEEALAAIVALFQARFYEDDPLPTRDPAPESVVPSAVPGTVPGTVPENAVPESTH